MVYYIMSKKTRGVPYVFQSEDGTQKVARFLFKESAEKIVQKMGDEFYVCERRELC